MLLDGECEGLGPLRAAQKFGLTKQRSFQLCNAFAQGGALALANLKRGPQRNYRRPDEIIRQVIRPRLLDPDASAAVLAHKLRPTGWTSSTRSVERVITHFGLQKKRHRCRPDADQTVPAQRSQGRTHAEPCDPQSLERGVRQLLADNLCRSALGLWRLLPEPLRLGTWDLLVGCSRTGGEHVPPRLALPLVPEAARCTGGIRRKRARTQRGFALRNGLPCIARDQHIHDLLGHHTVADAERLQGALGPLRHLSKHYAGKTLMIDPHRLRS
jgi:hypothetical protein